MSAILYLLPSSVAGGLLHTLVAWPTETSAIFAYVGPGAGLSMLGALFAVACVILLALLGPILYPIRLVRSMLRRYRQRQTALAMGPRVP